MSDDADIAATAAACEVTFDGRYYHFRAYRYERLADALRYARAQFARPDFVPDPAFVPGWLPAHRPDAVQSALMAQWGVGFDNGCYTFGPFRYDALHDAIACARRGA